MQNVVAQVGNRNKELERINKLMSSNIPCYEIKKGLFGGNVRKFLIDCETLKELD